jgi:uncharacterized protein YmfQ (DUF2313 family)
MGIMNKSLRGHLPKWRLGFDFRAVIDALAVSYSRLRLFFRGILTESNPGTAEDTLSEWYEQLGIHYDSTKDIESLQRRARQAYSTIGGQAIGYLTEKVQEAYPDVELEEVFIEPEFMVGSGMVGDMMVRDYPTWIASPPTDGEYPNFYYRVTGAVDDTWDLYGVENLLDRIMPAPYEPNFAITIRNISETGMVGLGMVGLMMVGKEEI